MAMQKDSWQCRIKINKYNKSINECIKTTKLLFNITIQIGKYSKQLKRTLKKNPIQSVILQSLEDILKTKIQNAYNY